MTLFFRLIVCIQLLSILLLEFTDFSRVGGFYVLQLLFFLLVWLSLRDLGNSLLPLYILLSVVQDLILLHPIGLSLVLLLFVVLLFRGEVLLSQGFMKTSWIWLYAALGIAALVIVYGYLLRWDSRPVPDYFIQALVFIFLCFVRLFYTAMLHNLFYPTSKGPRD